MAITQKIINNHKQARRIEWKREKWNENSNGKKALSIVVMICNLLVALFIDKHEKKHKWNDSKNRFGVLNLGPKPSTSIHFRCAFVRVVKLNKKRIYRMQNMQLEIPDVQHLLSDHHGECVEEERPAICWFFSVHSKSALNRPPFFFSDGFFDRLMLFALSTIILGVY